MNNKNLVLNLLKNKREDLDLRKISFLVLGLFVLIGFVYLVSAIQEISTVTLNATSGNNLTTDNLTATVSVLNLSQSYLYEWFKDGLSGGVFLGDGASQNTIPNWFTTVGETWYVNATPKVLTNNYNVSNASFVVNFSVVTEDNEPRGMAFNNDGTKLYVVGIDTDTIYEYNLSTPFNVSTGVNVSSFNVSAQDTQPTGMAFNNDGTKLYVVGFNSSSIYEYNLSVAFNVSTAVNVSILNVSSEEIEPQGMAFNNDGTKLYVVGTIEDSVVEYNLSTAFDVSTGVFNYNFSLSIQDNPQGMAFNNDGTKLYVIDVDHDTIHEYNLSVAFNVSTAVNVSELNVSLQDGAPTGMAFNNDGTKLYVIGTNGNSIYEYDVGSVVNGVTVQSNNLTILADTTPPNVFDLIPVTNTTFNVSDVIEIAANVTDNVAVDIVLANITLPNGTINQLTLSNSGGDKYNSSFTIPVLLGQYNITFIANDTSNNINSTETTFFVVNNQLPSVSSVVLNSTLGTNLTTENLTAYVTTSDPENDSVKVIYDWKKDGSSIAVLNMPFEGGSNSTFAKDYSDGSNNGTVTGATFNATGGYDSKGAYEFDGTGDYITMGDIFPTGSYTKVAWVKRTGGGNNNIISGDANHAFWAPTSLCSITNVLSAGHTNPYCSVTDNSTLTVDVWHHVAVTYDSSSTTMVLYKNGVEIDSNSTVPVQGDSTILYIGRFSTGNYWNGTLDEVMVFNRSLSSEQISALYNNRTDLIVSNETSIGDVWQVEATPNDGNQDGTVALSNNLTILADTTPPDVFDLIPVANSTFNVFDVIEIGVNVTDNVLVDTVLANITLPNGTINQLTLNNVSVITGTDDDKFNVSFTIPALIGQYNITFIANDTSNNINSTETTFFVVEDATNPNVFDFIPVSNSTFNVSDVIEIGVNVTDNILVDTVFANVTLPNGTINQITLSLATGDKYNNSFTIPGLIGTYNITFVANDTSNNINSTETSNFTVNDIVNPDVISLIPSINSVFNVSNVIEIAANVSDDVLVDTVLVNITLPNGTINQLILSNTSSTENGLDAKFNVSFTIPLVIGVYNITFIANDTSNNINSTETTFFVGEDATNPNVFDFIPVSNSTFNVFDVIEIGANVTDNVAVDIVLANITLPNGTINQLTLVNVSAITGTDTDKFNVSFVIPLLTGTYTIIFIANDTSGNVNSAETTNFTALPFISGSVILNATSTDNLTSDNLTATVSGLSPASASVLYEWFKDGLSGGVFLGDGASQNTIPNWFTTVGETWYVNATPKVLTNNYNVSNASFVDNLNVSAQDTAPQGMAFNNDGTKLYVIGEVGEAIYEYNLSTPFDVSTRLLNDNFSISENETLPQGMAFNNDGTKLYVIGNNIDEINEYDLSTPFDVSTGVSNDTLNVNAQSTFPTGMAFNNDGTKLYVVSSSDVINEYNLSTAFDVSTGIFVDNLNVSAQDTAPQGMAFNNDGTKLYVVGNNNNAIFEYNLSTPFDVSTGENVSSFDVSAQDTAPQGMAFNNDGTKLYMIGTNGDSIYEYDVGSVVNGVTVQSNNLTIIEVSSIETPSTTPTTGGGGGSCIYDSNYNWECSDWSSCVDEEQTRTCKESNNCGSSFGRPETIRTCEGLQLFDISFSLDDSTISNSYELSSVVTFESFGTIPTPVDLTFIILDGDGNEVYREKSEITVTTEEILRWNYETLQNLPEGKYTAVLETLYNIDVFDEFRQEFEIVEKRGLGIIGSIINFIRSEGNLLIGIIAIGVLVIGLAWWLIKRRKKKRLKKREITEPRARVLKRGYGQTGETDIGHDQKVRALLPGKRISKKGKVYYERRMDHSDVHGKKSTNKWRGSK